MDRHDHCGAAPAAAPTREIAARTRKSIALIGTVVRARSHAQEIIDRLAIGYAWNGGWHRPAIDVVALYVDQFPDNDLARARAARHGIPLYPSIGAALCRGESTLAVDGVVIIGEHGDYPKNARGQTLYPRHAFFKQVVRVFEDSGRAVPVFNDKHLSTDWDECVAMVADARRLGFPFMAGSSLPVTRRLPAIELPDDTPLGESVCAGYGGIDSYDVHGLEAAQCLSERRRGGEVGIASVLALKGDNVWTCMAERLDTQRLLVAALSRSHTLPVVDGYLTAPLSFDHVRTMFPQVTAYFIVHRDGFQTALFLLPIGDFNYAGLRLDGGGIISCQMALPMPGQGATTADFFNPLLHHIERMMIEGRAPYPVERTLLTSGMTIAAVESLHRGQVRVATPAMAVAYRAPPASTFWID